MLLRALPRRQLQRHLRPSPVSPLSPASVLGLRSVSDVSLFVARTRLGLEPLLRAELKALSEDFGLNLVIHEAETRSSALGALVIPEEREAEGAVEVSGPFEVSSWLLRCSLVQSIWLRVLGPFPCNDLNDLEEAVRETPWEDFVDLQELGGMATT